MHYPLSPFHTVHPNPSHNGAVSGLGPNSSPPPPPHPHHHTTLTHYPPSPLACPNPISHLAFVNAMLRHRHHLISTTPPPSATLHPYF
ncbi:hypothetical protein PILCRDRAFT_16463 [Piloderma croceum F 1598]|uniref:Uncharacterized protein n=1 Tax=Piloderma croceum (strain F 1598) TaxID=765440 RepID=A0A0C3EVN8_PILCF|nr:hypothetical protein PILCRDRAFT_16463 [Piloderma croceum F 1598]